MYAVCAPVGGFGNHVRLLLLLDNKFKFYFNNKVIAENIEEKLKIISTTIYPFEKSWHNWINKEFIFRESFNKSILFEHNHLSINLLPESKVICLTIEPELTYRCYFKFNSHLNSYTPEKFIQNAILHNKTSKDLSVKDNRFYLLEASNLFAYELNKSIYYKMINFFELEDMYDIANKIHGTWFNLQKKAEKDFVEYVKNLYKNNQ